MDIDSLELLQDEAMTKVQRWLDDALRRFQYPETQRQVLTDYMRMSDSAKKLMSSKHRQEMEGLKRRFDGSTGR